MNLKGSSVQVQREKDNALSDSIPLFLRRRQDPGRPGRLANPRLILFLSFSLIWRHLASPCTRLGGWKGVDRLISPRRLEGG
jgi:hypothetical protein